MSEFDQIMRQARRRALFDEAELHEQLNYDRAQIEQLLPHRRSFLLLDRIIAADRTAGRVLGTRRLDPADPVFEDHFPSDPVYPGVLLIEMMGQLALTLARLSTEERSVAGKPPAVRFIGIHDARFVNAAGPGDDLRVLSEVIDDNGYTFLACGQVMRGDEVLAAGVFEAMVLEETDE